MILICGASGLVGNELCKFFDSINTTYIGTYNNNVINKSNMYKIDFSDKNKLEEFLLEHKVKICIFCIVERLVDKCENNWNYIKNTNINLVNITSYLCNKLNIKFIHLSTDYVFDGTNQPNYPDSEKNPLQNYGISKLISEYRVIKNCKNYCIIRTPVLYTKYSKIHENAVCLIGKNVMDLRKYKIFNEDNYCIRRPLYIQDMCYFINNVIINNYNGIYHFYNPYNKYTKYEISIIIGNYLNMNTNNIIPNNTSNEELASRPYDTMLYDTKYNIDNYNFIDFKKSIEECFVLLKLPKISFENKNDIFIVLDLDGTILDTNMAHYNAYKKAFKKYNKEFLEINEWTNIILNDNIEKYIKIHFGENMINTIKNDKNNFLENETISFTKNSDIFLDFLIKTNINFCIVTNTSNTCVNIFKQKLPLLNNINQWITREDYNLPKPNGECYNIAKNKFYKNEKFIIGIEDSFIGYNSLKNITDLILIFNNENIFYNNDCYLFDDFNQIL